MTHPPIPVLRIDLPVINRLSLAFCGWPIDKEDVSIVLSGAFVRSRFEWYLSYHMVYVPACARLSRKVVHSSLCHDTPSIRDVLRNRPVVLVLCEALVIAQIDEGDIKGSTKVYDFVFYDFVFSGVERRSRGETDGGGQGE